jgi:pimeloyl-ACP methyl ester carboxylesterase
MKKQTLIAIHNNGGGAFHFDLLRPFWQDSINFAALNLPGCAGSHWKDELNNINDFLIHINREINLFNQDNLPLVLLGHGSGALLALKYAKLFPVKSLILHSPSNNNSWLNQGFLLNLKNNFLSMEAFQDLNKSFFFSQYVSKQYLKVFFEAFQNCKSYKQIAQLAELDLKIALNNLEIPAILLLGNNEEDRKNKQIFSEIKNPNLLIKSIPVWHNFPMIENAGDYATEIMELAEQL